jgi:hypothetical protein
LSVAEGIVAERMTVCGVVDCGCCDVWVTSCFVQGGQTIKSFNPMKQKVLIMEKGFKLFDPPLFEPSNKNAINKHTEKKIAKHCTFTILHVHGC